jgi:ABC-type multidrug transport system ATPase subunit
MGEQLPDKGEILLKGLPLSACEAGQAGIIQANGGMISNLKVWENITLPKWYHNPRQKRETEESLVKWLKILLPDESDWERFMASPVGKLRNSERKLAGILRMLVTEPDLLVIDAALFDDVDDIKARRWQETLEQYTAENRERALLALCHQSSRLPWSRIE